MKRITALVLVIVFIMGTITITSAEEQKDVTSHWAYEAMIYAIKNDWIDGKMTYAELEKGMIRQELAGLLNRVEKWDALGDNQFKDVNTGNVFYNDIVAMDEHGVMIGVGHNKFDPKGRLTREQGLLVFKRYFKLTSVEKFEVIERYTDKSNISDWAKEGVESFMSADGLWINEVEAGDGRFDSKGGFTWGYALWLLWKQVKPSPIRIIAIDRISVNSGMTWENLKKDRLSDDALVEMSDGNLKKMAIEYIIVETGFITKNTKVKGYLHDYKEITTEVEVYLLSGGSNLKGGSSKSSENTINNTIEEITITVNDLEDMYVYTNTKYKDLALPDAVTVYYSNGGSVNGKVEWIIVNKNAVITNNITLIGVLDYYGLEVKVNVIVMENEDTIGNDNGTEIDNSLYIEEVMYNGQTALESGDYSEVAVMTGSSVDLTDYSAYCKLSDGSVKQFGIEWDIDGIDESGRYFPTANEILYGEIVVEDGILNKSGIKYQLRINVYSTQGEGLYIVDVLNNFEIVFLEGQKVLRTDNSVVCILNNGEVRIYNVAWRDEEWSDVENGNFVYYMYADTTFHGDIIITDGVANPFNLTYKLDVKIVEEYRYTSIYQVDFYTGKIYVDRGISWETLTEGLPKEVEITLRNGEIRNYTVEWGDKSGVIEDVDSTWIEQFIRDDGYGSASSLGFEIVFTGALG